jgi:hypothetical protein
VLDSFQILNAEDFDVGEINILESMVDQRFDFGVGVLLPFKEGLYSGVNLFPDHLTIGEDETVLVVGVHSNYSALGRKRRFSLLKDEISPQPFAVSSQANCLGELPAFS